MYAVKTKSINCDVLQVLILVYVFYPLTESEKKFIWPRIFKMKMKISFSMLQLWSLYRITFKYGEARRRIEFLILNSISSISPDFWERGLYKTKVCTHQLKLILIYFWNEVLIVKFCCKAIFFPLS